MGGFVIIDLVSKSISHVSDSKEVIFVDSLRNLTQLEIKMTNLLDENKKVSFDFFWKVKSSPRQNASGVGARANDVVDV